MFRELWRCERTNTVPWALKVRANTVSWALEVRDSTSRHTSPTHLMLVPWASIWLFDGTSEAKGESGKWKAEGGSEGEGEVDVWFSHAQLSTQLPTLQPTSISYYLLRYLLRYLSTHHSIYCRKQKTVLLLMWLVIFSSSFMRLTLQVFKFLSSFFHFYFSEQQQSEY